MSDIYMVGSRGLMAFQSAMSYTAQNIANANTPYYTRREINFMQAMSGNGVDIASVSRLYDQYLSQRVLTSNSNFNKADESFNNLTELTSHFGSSDNNISKYITDARIALDSLNTAASEIGRRESFRDKLNAVSTRVKAIDEAISTQQREVNGSIQSVATSVNGILKNIASVNNQISISGSGEDNSALFDQQEQLMQQLGKYMDFSVYRNTDGQINLSVANGSSLVTSSNAAILSVKGSAEDPTNLKLELTYNKTSIDISTVISGGSLAGLFQTKQTLSDAANMLGRFSIGIIDSFNQQNKLGVDLNGNLGANLFTDINDSVVAASRVIANTNNTGTASLNATISNIGNLTTSNYQVKFDTSNHYSLTRLSDNKVVSSGTISGIPAQISADGFSVNIASGTIVAGDSFLIKPAATMSAKFDLLTKDAKLLALAWPVNAENTKGNLGSGNIKVDSIQDTTNNAFSTPGALNPPVIIKFTSGTTYQLINANDSSIIEDNITYDPAKGASVFPTSGGYDPGYRISLSGSPQKDDTFNVSYNSNHIGDNNNGKAMSDLFTKSIYENNSLSFSDAYNSMYSSITTVTNAAQSDVASSNLMYKQAMSSYGSVSGVNLQEELTNLNRYQQSFQACGQIIQTAKDVFGLIVSLGR